MVNCSQQRFAPIPLSRQAKSGVARALFVYGCPHLAD